MTEREAEEQANEILRQHAKSNHKSMRALGIIDERRARTIRERETPFADYFSRKHK
jgi:hypothetical protein